MRSLFGSKIINAPQHARYRKINQFIFVRQSFNAEVSKSQQELHQQVATKYNLTMPQLIDAIRLFKSQKVSQFTHNFPNSQTATYNRMEIQMGYEQNTYFGLGKTLDESVRILFFKYPEIAQLALPSSEKQKALLELEELFISNGPQIQNFEDQWYGLAYLALYEERIDHLTQSYKKQFGDEAAKELNEQLMSILHEYKENCGLQYGKIKSVIEYGLRRDVQPYSQVKEVDFTDRQKQITEMTKEFSSEEQAYALNVDLHDFRSLQQEVADQERLSGRAQNKTNEKGQRIVYETEPRDYHVLRFQILAAVLGGYFLYLLYRGDAKYRTIVAVPALSFFFYKFSLQNSARRSIPMVKQILMNSDNSLEVVIQRNRVLSRIENVAANNFKVHQNSKKFFETPYRSAHQDGYKVTINDQPALVPFMYTGNGIEVNKILTNYA